MENKKKKKELLLEAQAFNRRISERIKAGFIPDLRRAVKCNFFYKSFWRDPYFARLFLMGQIEIHLELLKKYGGKHLKILDVGCGPGYISLELARAGYHITGIDIADKAIKAAKNTLAQNPFQDNFGSLQYKVSSLEKMTGKYDVVLFTGVLHHLTNVESALQKSNKLLNATGLILCGEPSYDIWRLEDASQVAFIRALLSLTGYWYEKSIATEIMESEDKFENYTKDVYVEYITERDKNEKHGQSPNDLSTSGKEILKALKKNFYQLEYRDGSSFVYRMLGGLRGADKEIHKIADLLCLYERFAVKKGYLKPSNFFFIGRKK